MMVKRNPNMEKLQEGYLFPEISRRKKELLEQDPEADIISLGIGDTTEPLPEHISMAMSEKAGKMCRKEGYSGYGEEQGLKELRRRIAEVAYVGAVSHDEVFVSDGAKCDIGRIQLMFGNDARAAVQDPSYPVYVDGSVIMGQAGNKEAGKRYEEKRESEKKVTDKRNDVSGKFSGITYMPCTPENGFFPELKAKADIIYFCSPNNPTGAAATREQLQRLVSFAKENRSIIIFDSAYSSFITQPGIPKSIYEIKGSADVAIEVSSFSKLAGFTGVRLGWTVIPRSLKYDDGSYVIDDWNRVMTTIFNGASVIAQHGGLAALDSKGQEGIKQLASFYMENAGIIRNCLKGMGFEVYGGINAPYVWVRFPGKRSWDAFDELLRECHILSTPGSGFGPAGEGFLRLSAFASRSDVEEAARRMKQRFV